MSEKTDSRKTDFKKTQASYQARQGVLAQVEVPPMQYLMIDGQGDPNTAVFGDLIETLFAIAFPLKFVSKDELGRDYVVPPLEGRWWADELEYFTTRRDKSRWRWTLMVMTPAWLSVDHVAGVVESARRKKPALPLEDVRLERLDEGLCVQTLHVGAFDDEGSVLAQIHDEYLPEHGLRPVGTHHEIYLSDFRRVAPESRRTILRQPVTR